MTAKEITERIYKMYGTDSGFLFGLPPTVGSFPSSTKAVIETIIKIALKINKEVKE